MKTLVIRRHSRILPMLALVSSLGVSEAGARTQASEPTIGTASSSGRTLPIDDGPLDATQRQDTRNRARVLGLTLQSPELLVAAARSRQPSRLLKSERALLAQVVRAYRAGRPTRAAASLQKLTRASAKRDPAALAQIANHIIWAVVIEADPLLRRVVVGALYLEQKKAALASQVVDLRRQLERADSSMLRLRTKTFAKGKDGRLLTTTATRRVATTEIEAELARVELQLAGTTAALARIRESFTGQDDSTTPADPGADEAMDDALNDGLGGDAGPLLHTFQKLNELDELPDVDEQKQKELAKKRLLAEAYLTKCQGGDAAACKAYHQLLQEIAKLEDELGE
jgi:hypothetical protein